ncbi:hypothetical protein JJV70_04395 [Streptomyces sp. JJ66]|uniref:hypothetical protein n=1 Tax=Streptomyces sp. JJ66 TaxID=2803843 RepID=UPI001C59A233|nr:hypothetical protein [Streptomyces sp. JJ66]MBW1601355.1 hypothetical protein [Streptomyces sp. JJ66]
MTPDVSQVLTLRMDAALLGRITQHAARRRMSVQDYVVRLLVRDDFDERFHSAVERTQRFYARADAPPAPPADAPPAPADAPPHSPGAA